jgi:hypothetical protein
VHNVFCTGVLFGFDPPTPPPPHTPIPTHWDLYTRALLVSKDRRHLLVTPWQQVTENIYMCVCVAKVAQRRRGHESPEGTGAGSSQGSLAASSAGQGPPPSLGGGLGGAGALQVGTPFSPLHVHCTVYFSVADPVSGAFLAPGSWIRDG